MLTTARALLTTPELIMPAPAPAAPQRPRMTCAAHPCYVAGCQECQTAQCEYKAWKRRQKAYGTYQPPVDAEPARKHLRAVMDRWRLTANQIGPYVGITGWGVGRIATGAVQTIRAEHATAILALDADRIVRHHPALRGAVSSLGTARRLQALMAIGYSAPDLTGPLDAAYTTIGQWRIRACKTIGVRFYRRICTVYDELHTRPGPTPDVAAQARELEYAPPICWDDDDHLDNPAGRPRQYAGWLRLNPDPRSLAGAA